MGCSASVVDSRRLSEMHLFTHPFRKRSERMGIPTLSQKKRKDGAPAPPKDGHHPNSFRAAADQQLAALTGGKVDGCLPIHGGEVEG